MDAKLLEAFLAAIGARFRWNLAYWLPFGREWAKWEGCNAAFNPLATTQPHAGATSWNSVGVKEYASFQDGVDATVETLDPRTYGGIDYYPEIRAAIERQSLEGRRALVAAELRTWGTTGFANLVENGWDVTLTIPPTNDGSLEARVSSLETQMARLNTAILQRLEHLAEAAVEAANPNEVPS